MNQGPGSHPSPSKPKPTEAPQEKRHTGLGSETLHQIHAIIADPANFIDKGGAGIVYRMPQGLCIKVIQDRHAMPSSHAYNLGNDVAEESSFLQLLSKFHVAGVRTPRYIGYTRAKQERGGLTGILMEELKADNLEQILKKEVPVPSSFELHTFMDALEKYFNALNDEKGVVHGDIAARNIMVDRETGLPRVIDFGRSVKKDKISPDVWNKKIKEDWDHIEALSSTIEELAKQTNKSVYKGQ